MRRWCSTVVIRKTRHKSACKKKPLLAAATSPMCAIAEAASSVAEVATSCFFYTPSPVDAGTRKATAHLWTAEWQAVGVSTDGSAPFDAASPCRLVAIAYR